MTNSNITEDVANDTLKNYPTAYRASILNKNNEFVGFISVYNYDPKNLSTSIRLETNSDVTDEQKQEILDIYKKWVSESLNLGNINEEVLVDDKKTTKTSNEVIKSNIILPPRNLKEGIDEQTLLEMSKQYQVPKLQFPFTIVNGNQVIGIIGLTNLIWSNRRANLNIYLNKNIDESSALQISNYIIDQYLNYLLESNLYSISLNVDAADKKMLDLVENTNMQFYASIPYSVKNNNNIGSKFMFQHYPNMQPNGLYIPKNKEINESILNTNKKELSNEIIIDEKYRLVSPKIFDEQGINKENIILSHARSMEEREKFTKPLGEDKYMLQIGNGNYGLSKSTLNYTYILLDENNNYSGFINIIRTDENKKNAEIEVAINPSLQHLGLGTKVTNAFYNELFKVGYSSVTSAIFEFNNASLKMHEKIASFNGVRIGSYFINGKLWDMNFYTKVNPVIESDKNSIIR